MNPTAFPQASYPVVNRDGSLTQPWLQFFIALYNRTGGSIPDTPTDSTIQSMLTEQASSDSINRSSDRSLIGLLPLAPEKSARGSGLNPIGFPAAPEVKKRIAGDLAPFASLPVEERNAVRNAFLIGTAFSTKGEGDSARSLSVKAITVGASPFTYSAPTNGFVLTTGGTVSAVAFSRDGTTFLSVGFTAGIVPVRKNDKVRVTYTVAPTMNFIPM